MPSRNVWIGIGVVGTAGLAAWLLARGLGRALARSLEAPPPPELALLGPEAVAEIDRAAAAALASAIAAGGVLGGAGIELDPVEAAATAAGETATRIATTQGRPAPVVAAASSAARTRARTRARITMSVRVLPPAPVPLFNPSPAPAPQSRQTQISGATLDAAARDYRVEPGQMRVLLPVPLPTTLDASIVAITVQQLRQLGFTRQTSESNARVLMRGSAAKSVLHRVGFYVPPDGTEYLPEELRLAFETINRLYMRAYSIMRNTQPLA
jgi:hypothetical protein